MQKPLAMGDNSEAGFSLVEVIVGGAVIAIALAGIATLPMVIGRNTVSSQTQFQQHSGIDADIAEMKRLAHVYTYCLDTGTNTGSTTTTSCNGVNPGNQDFYFPPASNPSQITAFSTACTGGSLTSSLRTAMTGAASPGGGVTRTVSDDDASRHRVRITYTSTSGGTTLRVVTLVPTVAAWCPS